MCRASVDILIVDDHPGMHDVLTAVIRKALYSAIVHPYSTLEAALEAVPRIKDLRLVLLDLGLPGCTGTQALVRFKQKFPTNRFRGFGA
jgi:CheY-like chemotaxis protein